MRDMPDHLLTLTVKQSGKIYYINELVKRTGNRWFLPTRWFTRNGAMWAMGHHVNDSSVCMHHSCHRTGCNLISGQEGLTVKTDVIAAVPVNTFVANIEDILAASSGIYPFARSCDASLLFSIPQSLSIPILFSVFQRICRPNAPSPSCKSWIPSCIFSTYHHIHR
jgi:hypothetical protein